MPLLKLLFNPNPLIQALHIQSRLNTMNAERDARRESARRAMDQLYLRADAQPRRRNDAHGHRGEEPEDARRVDLEPAGVQRAASARARKRRRRTRRRSRRSAGATVRGTGHTVTSATLVAAVSASVQPAAHVCTAGSSRASAAAGSGGDHRRRRAQPAQGQRQGSGAAGRRSGSAQPQAAPTPRAARRCRRRRRSWAFPDSPAPENGGHRGVARDDRSGRGTRSHGGRRSGGIGGDGRNGG